LLGMDLISMRMIQAMATDKKPAPKLLPELLPVNKAAKKAMIAIAHQGNMKPEIKERMSIMRNSTFVID